MAVNIKKYLITAARDGRLNNIGDRLYDTSIISSSNNVDDSNNDHVSISRGRTKNNPFDDIDLDDSDNDHFSRSCIDPCNV